MWIKYSDSEVNVFHPICESALIKSLEILGRNDDYTVLHHQHTGSLEMDFVIQNKNTGKYVCVIEVKRTPTDVHSARYQYQAMSYVQMNYGQTETPFYILTNLEYAFSFRFDTQRPRVFQQMLSPGLECIGLFNCFDSKEEFINILTGFFKEKIKCFLENDYSYLVTLEQFALHMDAIKQKPKKWKSNLAILLYEYIRGAFSVVSRNDLHDVRLFYNDIIKICNEAAHINFHEIFDYSESKYEPTAFVNDNLLINLFDFGYQNVNGDSVADILHQIVSSGHEHEGEVPTDLELGRVLALLSHSISGDLNENEKLCDPAAGSGNLISSSISEYKLKPSQIIANDIKKQLGELLTLRLGLNFTRIVGENNTPVVTCENICNLNREYFNDVKVLVMNPPFLGGVYAFSRKQEFYNRINELAGFDTGTNVGQMPLEAAFLELVSYLVKPGTIIACVFPKTHLLARGAEAKTVRRIILEKLGLNCIFTYPGKGIFTDVTKDTCVLIGKAMQICEHISVLTTYNEIPDLDLQRFSDSLKPLYSEKFETITPGILAKSIHFNELYNSIDDGWRGINSEMVEAIEFVCDNFSNSDNYGLIKDLGFSMKRGGAANSGGSDLLFFDSRDDLFSQFPCVHSKLKSGMRNAEIDSINCSNGDSKFLDVRFLSDNEISDIIDLYLSLDTRSGVQARYAKTKQEWIKILNRESRGVFGPYSVLIPRALRKKGRVYYSENDIFVSTNFLVCYNLSKKNAVLLSTWVSSIFYQLICEVSSKDQEGMRKMEIADIGLTFIPKLENVSALTYSALENELNNIVFLDLQSPLIRNVDLIWARELFGDAALEKAEEAKRLLGYISTRRNP